MFLTPENSPKASQALRDFVNKIVAQFPSSMPPYRPCGGLRGDFLEAWDDYKRGTRRKIKLPKMSDDELRAFLWKETMPLPYRLITDKEKAKKDAPYMHRHAVGWDEDEGWIVYIHEFNSSDIPPPHNHPFPWAYSTVLLGSYTERVVTDLMSAGHEDRVCEAGDVAAFKGSDDFHRVMAGETVWTLFIASTKYSALWGHLEDSGEVTTGIYKNAVPIMKLVPAKPDLGSSGGGNWWHDAPTTRSARKKQGR